eukprot:1767389-Rhodomonas_salina.1
MHVTTPDYKEEGENSDAQDATGSRQQYAFDTSSSEQSLCSHVSANPPFQFDSSVYALQSSLCQQLGKRAREDEPAGSYHTVLPLEEDWITKRACNTGSFSDLLRSFQSATPHTDLQQKQTSPAPPSNLSYAPVQGPIVHGVMASGSSVAPSMSLAEMIANLQRSLAATTKPGTISPSNGVQSQQPYQEQHAAAQAQQAPSFMQPHQQEQACTGMGSPAFAAPKPQAAPNLQAPFLAGSTNSAVANCLQLIRSNTSSNLAQNLAYSAHLNSVPSTPTASSLFPHQALLSAQCATATRSN